MGRSEWVHFLCVVLEGERKGAQLYSEDAAQSGLVGQMFCDEEEG